MIWLLKYKVGDRIYMKEIEFTDKYDGTYHLHGGGWYTISATHMMDFETEERPSMRYSYEAIIDGAEIDCLIDELRNKVRRAIGNGSL